MARVVKHRRVMSPSGQSTRALIAAVLAEPDPERGPWLRAIQGPSPRDRLAVRDGAVLGRGRAADLRLPDGLASRRHARFTRVGACWRVHDLGSKNGVRVNGRRAAAAGALLAPGDRVAVGATLLLFEASPLAPSTAPEPVQGGTAPGVNAKRRPILIAAALVAAAAAFAVAAG